MSLSKKVDIIRDPEIRRVDGSVHHHHQTLEYSFLFSLVQKE